MKAFGIALLACLVFPLNAANIFESLTGWTLGNPQPVIVQDTRHGTSDQVNVLQMGPGVAGCTYRISPTDGEGSLIMWVYDSAVDCSNADKGYPLWGPKWGISNSLYQTLFACVQRASYVGYNSGYEVSSSVSPYSMIWYHWTARPEGFTAGWNKWEFVVTFDNVTVKWGASVSQTYDATNEIVGAFMGSGANGVYVMGDGTGGPETFKFDDYSGTGIFDNSGSGNKTASTQTTWSAVKTLFR